MSCLRQAVIRFNIWLGLLESQISEISRLLVQIALKLDKQLNSAAVGALALYQTDNNIWHSISGLWDFKIFKGKRVRAMLNHVSRILFYAFYLISWECGWLSLTSWMVPGLLESSTSSASLWATWSCWTSPIWWRYLRMRGTQCLFWPQHYCL